MGAVKKGLNKGRGIGGLTTKVHAVVDGLGNPLHFLLSPGMRNDIVYAQTLLAPFDLRGKKVVADMGYDQEAFCTYIRQQGGDPVIPSRRTNRIRRTIDAGDYSERHLVENLFQKLKNHRRFATRYDKLDCHFASLVALACSLIWLL